MRTLIPAILFLILSFFAKAAALSGTITNEKGKPLSFASISVKETTNGVIANAEGKYSIQLLPGNYEIIFQYVGYAKKTEHVTVANEAITLNVSLVSENHSLKEVVINANTEDPAYGIIRNAIKRRKSYLTQVDEYSCKVYIKNVQQLDSVPRSIFGFKIKSIDSSLSGIVYLSESESQFNFKEPDKIKEVIFSSRVSGNNQAFSWNTASAFEFNFYKNLLYLGQLSPRGLVSPISETAMLYYKYKLESAFYEDGVLVNKIAVIPRRQHDPVFRGYIYIVEGTWRIHSTDLFLTKDNNIDFLDSLFIKQSYILAGDTTWMPFTQNLAARIRFLGIKFNARYIGVFTNYNIHPNFQKNFFDNEEIKVNDDANKKDSSYWSLNRPIQLAGKEIRNYHKKDSIVRVHSTKQYLDSVDAERSKFKIRDLLFGYQYHRRFNKTTYSAGGLTNFINYNTVEGWAPVMPLSFSKGWTNDHSFKNTLTLRYGTSNRIFSVKEKLIYNSSPRHFTQWSLEGGRYVEQINENDPITPLINAGYTLFYKENYMKLFLDNYIKGAYQSEVVNGLTLSASASYGIHSPLENTTYFTWSRRPGDSFTSNYPYPDSSHTNFKKYNALVITVGAEIHFGQKYITRPNRKIILDSKYPVLNLVYKKGINALGSTDNFDQVEARVSDKMSFGLFGNFQYSVSGGVFINHQSVGIAELKHFNGNQTIFAPLDHFGAYELLPYYQYSTDSHYIEAHIEHHFNGFILNKIPFIRSLKWYEVGGLNFLYTPSITYTELSVGLEHIFKVLRVDYVTSYSNRLKLRSGFLLGLGLSF